KNDRCQDEHVLDPLVGAYRPHHASNPPDQLALGGREHVGGGRPALRSRHVLGLVQIVHLVWIRLVWITLATHRQITTRTASTAPCRARRRRWTPRQSTPPSYVKFARTTTATTCSTTR